MSRPGYSRRPRAERARTPERPFEGTAECEEIETKSRLWIKGHGPHGRERMKDNPKPITELRLIDRLKEIDISNERPPDRELRRLRGLSAEVGAACTAWLTARGIKSRSWGTFELKSRRVSGPRLEFFPDPNS